MVAYSGDVAGRTILKRIFSSVIIVSRLRVDGSGLGILFTAGTETVLFFTAPRPLLGPILSPLQ
jgi:hypothetical protein